MDFEDTLIGGPAISKYLKTEKGFTYELIKHGVVPAHRLQNTFITTKTAVDKVLAIPLGELLKRAEPNRRGTR
jgi:hypothetical protein